MSTTSSRSEVSAIACNTQHRLMPVPLKGAKISQQIFGVGTASEILTVGIMGAGPDLYGWEAPYPLPIDNLFTQGFINHRAFSLDMRSIESSRGET